MNDPQPWETRSTRQAFANRWIKVLVDDVALPDGRSYEYTRLEPAGVGVGIIGFNSRREVLLEREYRHGVNEVIWQLPGGLADVGEDLRTAGLRELREETGYAPRVANFETVRYLGMVWDNPAFGHSQSHIYVAWDLVPVTNVRRDPAEYVTLHWKPAKWLLAAVQDGQIKDRVVVAAVAQLLINRWLDP